MKKKSAMKKQAPKVDVAKTTPPTAITEIKETQTAIKPVEKETQTAIKPVEKETQTAIKPVVKETQTAIKVVEKETQTAIKPVVKETQTAVKVVENETPVAVKAVEKETPATIKPEVKATVAVADKEPVKKEAAKKPATKKPAAKKPAVKKADPLKPEIIIDGKPLEAKPAAKATTKKSTSKKASEDKAPVKKGEIKVDEIGYKKRIALVGAECVPFAKTGGLADVLGTLPGELNQLDIEASVFLPFHKVIKDKYRMETQHITFFYVNLGWRTKFVGVEKLVLNGVTYYFIDNEDYFGGQLYLGQQPEGEQYAFFCRAVLEAMLRMNFIPDVIHLNDWQTAMIAMLLRTQYQATPLSGVKTLFTIHNMMYQGMYGFDFVQSLLGIDTRYYTPEFMEANGCANFMKAGLVFSDRISTVSPTYAGELKDPYYSYGLEGILNARAHQTTGILNGIDVLDYNPETDVHIPAHFSKTDLSGKAENKRILMEKLGLHYSADTPLIGMVSRLTSQKGFDLIKSIFHELMALNVSVVLLGTGDKEYESFFGRMENEYRGRVCSYIGYNNEVAHQIYAGADLFLMPSKFEPCGISQMIAQRYGTLPIARETGGLKDTVLPFNEYTGEGTGFTFTNYNSHDMLDIIKYALYCFEDVNKRACLIKNTMNCDNSFAVSAKKYRDLYYSL